MSSWEFPRHMQHFILPSVYYALEQAEDSGEDAVHIRIHQMCEGEVDDETILAKEEAAWKELGRYGWRGMVQAIADHALKVSATSIGGFKIHLDTGGWCEIPFCTDEQAEEYYE